MNRVNRANRTGGGTGAGDRAGRAASQEQAAGASATHKKAASLAASGMVSSQHTLYPRYFFSSEAA